MGGLGGLSHPYRYEMAAMEMNQIMLLCLLSLSFLRVENTCGEVVIMLAFHKVSNK